MVQLHVERTIAAPPERTFDWLTDPANLTTAPLFLRAGWAKGFSGASVGAMREVTAVGAWLREEITAYDAPRSYSHIDVHSVRRRHARRVGQHLHHSRPRGREGDRSRHCTAFPLELPRDPRWMRKGVGELAVAIG
jgi:hypothetical protein